jgi:hypothetical protein
MHGPLNVKHRKIVWKVLFHKLPVAKELKRFCSKSRLSQKQPTKSFFAALVLVLF